MEKMICRQGMADTSQAWIYYKESGRGIPILMLHGNAETHLIFDYYEKKLSIKYRVILMTAAIKKIRIEFSPAISACIFKDFA